MINLLNLNIYKIFHFCPHMIFDQILNGTPIFFSKFEDLWTGEFFFLLANTIGNVEKVLKKIGNTQFSFYGHQRVGVPPWWRRFSKNGTNHEKASRPSNFGHIFKKIVCCNQWSIFHSILVIFFILKPPFHIIIGKCQLSCGDMRQVKMRYKLRKKHCWAWQCIFPSPTTQKWKKTLRLTSKKNFF